jgi:hypothetical protein
VMNREKFVVPETDQHHINDWTSLTSQYKWELRQRNVYIVVLCKATIQDLSESARSISKLSRARWPWKRYGISNIFNACCKLDKPLEA